MQRRGPAQASRRGRAPVVVIGGGIGGLCAALGLAGRGARVVLLEAAAALGGKARPLRIGGQACDAGPTVITMAWVFRRALAEAGLDPDAFLPLERLDGVVARHLFGDGSRLDLQADPAGSEAAIAAFAGPEEAAAYRRYTAYARGLWQRVEQPFVLGPKPTWRNLWPRHSLRTLAQVARIDAHLSMRTRLARTFADPRLRQLFGRMSTYAGGAPGLTPATYNLIAHVETLGVWRCAGGVGGLVEGLGRALAALGVEVRLGARVEVVVPPNAGGTAQIGLAGGDGLEAEAVVADAPPRALAGWIAGALPPPARAEPVRLSADTACFVAEAPAGALAHHTLIFADHAEPEFTAIFAERRRPASGTVYLCAQGSDPASPRPQPMLCLVNAPSTTHEESPCLAPTLARLARLGLPLRLTSPAQQRGPADWRRLSPEEQGGLYGEPPHGWRRLFTRPGSHTRWPRIYLAGGNVHPGPGLPMTALGGLAAAAAWASDLGSTCRWPRAATPGGTSMPTATTAAGSSS